MTLHRLIPGRPLRFAPLVALVAAGISASAWAQEGAPTEKPKSALPVNAGGAPGAGAKAAPQAAPEGAPAGEVGGEMISFSAFSEPISISALIDFIAEQLGVIIMQTEVSGLAGATVEFSAPIEVPKSQLLSLLQTLLTPKGYGLFKSPEGFYTVMPAGQSPVDFSGGEFSPTRIIRTPLLTPTSIKPAIDTAIGADHAKMVYLDELGLIISTAPPRVNDAIEAVVERISKEVRDQKLQRIELTHIAASEAKARILELTGQAAQANAAPGQAVQGAATTGGARAGNLGNLRDRLLIDRPTNALIFRGSSEEAEQVRRLVAIVDTPTRLIVRRYYAGPTAAEVCQVGSRRGLGPIMQAAATAGARTGGGGGLGSGFVLSSAANESFTYYGTESQHKQVKALVDEFAAQSREETFIVEFYKLRNVSAEDTASLLTSLMEIDTTATTAQSPFLPGSQAPGNQRGITRLGASPVTPPPSATPAATPPAGQAGAGGAPGAPAGAEEANATLTPVEGVSVIADIPNNQLIIRAPRRQQREFARIIKRLDERPIQVYIEVQIVTVNSDKTFQLSVDTALTSPNSDVPVFTNFGLVPFGSQLSTPNSTKGFTAAVFRNQFTPAVINALATKADAKQISMPKILVNNNEEATLSSTQDISFASTSQGQATSITSTGGNVSAGTTLTVTPTVSERGTLRLDYSIELSAFGAQPNPDLPPNRNVNNFTSIVTVPADSTIVVGGLITNSKSNSVSKVPLLGDIPLIGHAFQAQVRSNNAQTVYVFITPHILRDESFQDLRLLTHGPMREVGVKDTTPRLAPVKMPIFEPHEQAGSGL